MKSQFQPDKTKKKKIFISKDFLVVEPGSSSLVRMPLHVTENGKRLKLQEGRKERKKERKREDYFMPGTRA